VTKLSSYRCPKCGQETQYKAELNGLCINCYIELKKDFLNILNLDKTPIKRCKYCKKIFLGNNWIKSTNSNLAKAITTIIKDKLKRSIPPMISFKIEVLSPEEFILSLRDEVAGIDIGSRTFSIQYKEQICQHCMMKFSGNLYDCIIRVRGAKRQIPNLEQKLNNILRRNLDEIELIGIKKMKGGNWDLFFANKRDCDHIAKILASSLKMEIKKFSSTRYFKGIKKSIVIVEYVIS